jgi:hypothetical protein
MLPLRWSTTCYRNLAGEVPTVPPWFQHLGRGGRNKPEGKEKDMWMRATRWAIAALIGSAMSTIGCVNARAVDEGSRPAPRKTVMADDSLVRAFDTHLEARLLDRLELDYFLRDRDIRLEVADGVVDVTGRVWTPLEKQRVSELLRGVAGVIDVDNHLDVQPPEW